jgi:hypothetical protein
MDWSLYGILKKFTGRLGEGLLVERGRPGVELSFTPAGPEAPDVGDAVQGVGVSGLRRPRRLRRLELWFCGGRRVVVDRDYARVCGGLYRAGWQ